MLPLLEPAPTPTRKCWTRAEYERFIDRGAFTPEARLELIEGEILEKMPQGIPHSNGIGALQETFNRVFPAGYWVRVQSPFPVGTKSVPEPDVAVVIGNWRDYRDHQPEAALLIVEVSDTSLEYDRTVKAKLYARAAVPDYWILNLNERILEVYRTPVGTEYTEQTDYDETQTVTLNGQTVEVKDLLP